MKLTVLGSAGLLLPFAETARAARRPVAEPTIATSVHGALRRATGVGTGAPGRDHRLLPARPASRRRGDHPKPAHDGAGYNGLCPARRSRRHKDVRRWSGRSTCRRTGTRSWATSRRPRRTCTGGVVTAVRRLRQRPHFSGPVHGLPLPELPVTRARFGITTTWWPARPRTPTSDSRATTTSLMSWKIRCRSPKATTTLRRPLSTGSSTPMAACCSTTMDRRRCTGMSGNGRPWPVMPVERRKYRFRILNASNGRGYRLT
jgi:hypothetical protein